MKIRILLLLSILFGMPSSSFISKANEKIAKEVPMRYSSPPIERQKEQIKRPKSKLKAGKVKPILKSQKEQQKKKKWLPWLLGLLGIPLLVGATFWGIYFFSLLAAGFNVGCASAGCAGLIGAAVLTFVAVFFGMIFFILLVGGAVTLIVLSIVIAQRYKKNQRFNQTK